jgi:hypothetical protein
VIPGPLVAPRTPVAHEPRAGVAARTLAVVCFVLAAAGAWGWLTAWSPVGFTRWEVFQTSSTMTLEPGTYVVYEEFAGASGPTSRQPLSVLVRSIAGREIDVTPLLGPPADPQSAAAARDEPDVIDPAPYRTPWHEGRATAWFEIDRSGTYTITAFASRSASDARDYNELLTSFVALAPLGEPGPLGSGTGLLLVVFVPLAAGLAILAVARLRWPRPRASARRSSPTPAP